MARRAGASGCGRRLTRPLSGARWRSSRTAAPPATRFAAPPRSDAIGPDLTHVGSRLRLAAGTLPNEPEALVRWIRRADRIKPGVHMPAFRALRRTTCRRSPPISAACGERRSGTRPAVPGARAARPGRSPAESLGDAEGVALLVVGQQPARRCLVYGSGVRLLPLRRRARAAHAHPARRSEQRFPVRGALQPDLHGPRIRDDVPLRGPDLRGVLDSHPAAGAGRPGPAVSAALGVRLLGFIIGGIFLCGSLFFDAAPRGGWFMYPPLTSTLPAGHRRRHLAARLLVHRGGGDRRRRRADRRRAQVPAARHADQPDSALFVVHARGGGDGALRVSAAHRRQSAAGARARLCMALLRSRRAAAIRCCGSTCSGSSATRRSTSSSCPRSRSSR